MTNLIPVSPWKSFHSNILVRILNSPLTRWLCRVLTPVLVPFFPRLCASDDNGWEGDTVKEIKPPGEDD